MVIELTKLLGAEREHMGKDSEAASLALPSGAQRGAALEWYLVITVLGEPCSSAPVTHAAEERSQPGASRVAGRRLSPVIMMLIPKRSELLNQILIKPFCK